MLLFYILMILLFFSNRTVPGGNKAWLDTAVGAEEARRQGVAGGSAAVGE